MAKIYISSTFEDLKDYREAAYDALRKIRQDAIAMEDYIAQDQRPLQKCLDDVASCNIYIGIFAWRYGFIPLDEKDNPENLSITELEYRKAKEKGIPCIIFLLDEGEAWPPAFMDGMPKSNIKSSENIIRLRNYFKNEYLASFFKNKDELSTKVLASVNQIKLRESESKQKLQEIEPHEDEIEFREENKKIFVGREKYINKIIKEKLTPGSTVSIIGPGGSGKTQLAFKAIKEYVKEKIFDFVCPLYFFGSIPSFSSFLIQIAERLELSITEFEKENDVNKRKRIIIRSLKNKKNPLIYLDNYETISLDINKQRFDKKHKPSPDSFQIEYFLKNEISENTTILLTSREINNRLSNRLSETPIDLEGLDKYESRDLFIRLTSPDISKYIQSKKKSDYDKATESTAVTSKALDNYHDNDNLITYSDEIQSYIDEIIKITGGHPLSLEIIAKNIDSIYDLQNISSQLNISEASMYNPEERLQSLDACFDYTFNKLSKKLKNLLLKLTIFNSPFPIDAPIKIFDDDSYNESDIIQLYNRSLVTRIEFDDLYGKINMKYWLYTFHPATRNYLDNKIRKPISKDSFGFLDSLLKDNRESFSFYYLDLLSYIYDSIGKGNHRDALGIFNIISQGKDNDFEHSVTFLQDIDNQQKGGYILSYLGLILKETGLYAKAIEYHKRSLRISKIIDDRVGLARDYGNIGVVYYKMGNYPQALEYYNKALEIDKELNDRVGLGKDYGNIGVVYDEMGNYPQALEYHIKALEIRTELNDRVGLGKDYGNIGVVYDEMGNYPQALEYHIKALEIRTELNDRVGLARDYNNIGLVYYKMGNYPQALEYHNKALEIDTELNDRVGLARDYNNIGNVYYGMGNYPQALEYHNKALEIRTGLNDRVGLARDYNNIGLVYDEMGNYPQALEYYNKALEIRTELNDRVGIARTNYNMSFLLLNMNEKNQALDHLSIAKNVLFDLKNQGYAHPLLKDIEQRISFINSKR